MKFLLSCMFNTMTAHDVVTKGASISSHGTELVNLKYPGFGTREEVLEGSITTDCTQYDEHTQVHMESQKAPEGKIKWN